ncbi:5199_t:CDS:1 [Funneliformis geosporum]|uniref:18650_t:CDS:1 n=1 Tax=Funneliformis geosporum TaxID=1117311 RepID=A0A9W4WKZ9_9GLOM|nr:5199_t:CDS:1 [Funneliformis geosporum]CAI2169830.1 18650_t:CDS:1 [Funneliformis geosporum]
MLEIALGLVYQSEDITDDLLLSYDHEFKIIAVEIYGASNVLHVSFIQGNPRFVMNHMYHEDSDILEINLVNYTPRIVEFKKTEVEDVEIGMDNDGKLVSLLFYNASNRVLETLSEDEREERANLAKEFRKRYSESLKMNKPEINMQEVV